MRHTCFTSRIEAWWIKKATYKILNDEATVKGYVLFVTPYTSILCIRAAAGLGRMRGE